MSYQHLEDHYWLYISINIKQLINIVYRQPLIYMKNIYLFDWNLVSKSVQIAIKQARENKHLDLSYQMFKQVYRNSNQNCSEQQGTRMIEENQSSIIYFMNFSDFEERMNTAIIELLSSHPIDNCVKALIIQKAYYKQWKGIIQHISLHCRLITSIDINTNAASDGVLELISRAKWKFIVYFDCSNNKITSRGVGYICRCQWPYLKKLNLQNNEITNNGLRYLAKAEWPYLTDFLIGRNKTTVDGLRTLSRCCWNSLAQLSIDSAVGNEGLKIVLGLLTIKLKYIVLQQSPDSSRKSIKSFHNLNQIAKRDISLSKNIVIAPFDMYSHYAHQNLSNAFQTVMVSVPLW